MIHLDLIYNCFDQPGGLCNPNPCFPGVACTPLDWYFQCGPCPGTMWGDGISCFENLTQHVMPSTPMPPCSDNDVVCQQDKSQPQAAINGGLALMPLDNPDDPCRADPCFPGVVCNSSGVELCAECPYGYVVRLQSTKPKVFKTILNFNQLESFPIIAMTQNLSTVIHNIWTALHNENAHGIKNVFCVSFNCKYIHI